MRPLHLAIGYALGAGMLAAAVMLGGCGSSGGPGALDIVKQVRTMALGVVDAVAVKGVLTTADAGAVLVPGAAAGDKVLDSHWTEKVRDRELPKLLDKFRDAAFEGVARLCSKGHLSAQDAAAIGVAGAVEGDPVWSGKCADLIRAGG